MAGVWFLCFVIIALGDCASLSEKNEVYDTIIVGMGAAGISAASELARAGKRVLGLEAQGRLGGRVNTVSCGTDGVVELGAEWIHGTEGSPTYKLAIDNGVDVRVQEFDRLVVWSDGGLGDSQLMDELVNITMEAPFDRPEEPEPLGQHITKKILAYLTEHHPDLLKDQEFINEFLSFADLIIDGYDGSDTWNDTTTHDQYTPLNGSQDMSWHMNGYKTLFNILLNKYKDGPGLPTLKVKLNTEVTKITWPENPQEKVVVTSKDGAEYTADNVIVTVSIGVLKERHDTLFSPRLPSAKTLAFDSITLGLVNKIVLIFPEAWWDIGSSFGFLWRAGDKSAVPENDSWITKIAGTSSPMGCDNALTLWTNGVTARYIETLSEDEVKAKSMELLKKFLGRNYTITEPVSIYRTTWFSNPFTRGSYSFDNINAPAHPTARQDLAAPLVDSSGKPRVLFAGEATSQTQYSTVHGAVSTGKREAARILRGAESAAIGA